MFFAFSWLTEDLITAIIAEQQRCFNSALVHFDVVIVLQAAMFLFFLLSSIVDDHFKLAHLHTRVFSRHDSCTQICICSYGRLINEAPPLLVISGFVVCVALQVLCWTTPP